jgi:uncharacterized membrane protein YoaK (UPF0700 family)
VRLRPPRSSVELQKLVVFHGTRTSNVSRMRCDPPVTLRCETSMSVQEAKPAAAPTTRQSKSLLLALLVLTFNTGLIDAVSYIGLGRVFVANMTGNVVLLAFAAAGISGLSVTRALSSLGGFLIGATIGGKLGTSLAAGSRRRLILCAGILEGFLIFAVAVSAIGFDMRSSAPAHQLYAMIVLTALSMGLRNATVRQLRVADITTTVLTLTLTGLAADSSVAGGSNPRPVRRIFSIIALFVGALSGAYLLRYGVALPLFVTGACVLLTTAAYTAIAATARE